MSREAILEYLSSVQRASPGRVALETKIPRTEVDRLLKSMRENGDLRRTGPHYYLPPVGASVPTVMAIVQALADGSARDVDEIARIEGEAGRHRAPSVLARAMMDMGRAGIIARTARGWMLAEKGRRMLPSVAPEYRMRPYVPPKSPPRRPGSMAHLSLPSVYSGAPV